MPQNVGTNLYDNSDRIAVQKEEGIYSSAWWYGVVWCKENSSYMQLLTTTLSWGVLIWGNCPFKEGCDFCIHFFVTPTSWYLIQQLKTNRKDYVEILFSLAPLWMSAGCTLNLIEPIGPTIKPKSTDKLLWLHMAEKTIICSK